MKKGIRPILGNKCDMVDYQVLRQLLPLNPTVKIFFCWIRGKQSLGRGPESPVLNFFM